MSCQNSNRRHPFVHHQKCSLPKKSKNCSTSLVFAFFPTGTFWSATPLFGSFVMAKFPSGDVTLTFVISSCFTLTRLYQYNPSPPFAARKHLSKDTPYLRVSALHTCLECLCWVYLLGYLRWGFYRPWKTSPIFPVYRRWRRVQKKLSLILVINSPVWISRHDVIRLFYLTCLCRIVVFSATTSFCPAA